jgi:mRNA-degrading endonuclease RelE of RelBE toxin-antitoxin system
MKPLIHTLVASVDPQVNHSYTIAMSRVFITDEATAQARKLPKPIQARVLRIFDRLESWPAVAGAKPLSGRLAGHYRIRTGDYRVQFRIQDRKVVVERIGHRDGFYES